MLFDFIKRYWLVNPTASFFMAGGGTSRYSIANSVRLRASASAYLSRTPGAAGNQKLLAWRGRIKRGALGSAQVIVSAGTASIDKFYFDSSDRLCLDVLGTTRLVTTQVFRDPTAWYVDVGFIIDVANGTAASRAKILIDGTEVTSYSTDSRASITNTNTNWCNTVVHYLGRDNAGSYFDGIIAQAILVDGSTSSTFSTTDTNGVRVPVAPSATYGTTGSYLPFSDTSGLTSGSNTGLGKDFSGNGNYWNTNAISLTAGVTYDALADTPTNNYCAVSSLDKHPNLNVVNGGLGISQTAQVGGIGWRGTHAVSSGKWYWEMKQGSVQPSRPLTMIGIDAVNTRIDVAGSGAGTGAMATSWLYYQNNGNKYNNGSGVAYGTSWAAGDIIGVALDLDSGKLFFSKNGTWQNSGDPSAGTNYAFSGLSGVFAPSGSLYVDAAGAPFLSDQELNFGQRPFTYTPPTGFKALCTANLPAAPIPNGRKHYDAALWTGNNGSQSVTGIGFQPDMLMGKSRNQAFVQITTDSVRGVTKQLFTSNTNAEQTNATYLSSFNSDGFSMAGGNSGTGAINTNGDTYVGWLWKGGGAAVANNVGTISANPTAGFSICSWPHTSGVADTVNHGLGFIPDMAIWFDRTNAGNHHFVQHKSLSGGLVGGNCLYLDTNGASAANFVFSAANGTSVTFIAGSGTGNMLAYFFREIAGYSKFGSYPGNGSADGPFIYCGFRPRYILIKQITAASTTSWWIEDTARSTCNVSGYNLQVDSAGAETVANNDLDILSNGFKLRLNWSGNNVLNGTYIFAAFAENPFGGSNVAPATAR